MQENIHILTAAYDVLNLPCNKELKIYTGVELPEPMLGKYNFENKCVYMVSPEKVSNSRKWFHVLLHELLHHHYSDELFTIQQFSRLRDAGYKHKLTTLTGQVIQLLEDRHVEKRYISENNNWFVMSIKLANKERCQETKKRAPSYYELIQTILNYECDDNDCYRIVADLLNQRMEENAMGIFDVKPEISEDVEISEEGEYTLFVKNARIGTTKGRPDKAPQMRINMRCYAPEEDQYCWCSFFPENDYGLMKLFAFREILNNIPAEAEETWESFVAWLNEARPRFGANIIIDEKWGADITNFFNIPEEEGEDDIE